MIASLALGSVVYDLFDTGLANALGLETLRHGTNPIHYLQIRVRGGDPHHGGKAGGATRGWCTDDTRGFFYVFKDSELGLGINDTFLQWVAHSGVFYRTYARAFAGLSGYNFVAQFFPGAEYPPITRVFQTALSVLHGVFSGLVTPILRFRFSEIDAKRLKDDPVLSEWAYRTQRVIEAWRIGLLGSLCTGVNLGWFSRAQANPLKVITGLVQLVAAMALAILGIQTMAAYPILAVTGALLA